MLKRRQEIYEEIYPLAKAEEKRKIGINVSAETVSALTDAPDTFTVDTAKKRDYRIG